MFLKVFGCMFVLVALTLSAAPSHAIHPAVRPLSKSFLNGSFMLGSTLHYVAREMSEESTGKYRISSKWQSMRILASTNAMATETHVCSRSYYYQWAYDMRESWEWCGSYCSSWHHTNYVDATKMQAALNTILPRALKNFLEYAPLIRRETTNLTVGQMPAYCRRVVTDPKHHSTGVPNMDAVVYFAMSPFLRADSDLSLSRSCQQVDGRTIAGAVNINPCFMMDNLDRTVEKTADRIAALFWLTSCPKAKNTIMLHTSNGWDDRIVMCVQVRCNDDKTFDVKPKDLDWIRCNDHHVLDRTMKGAKLMCPKFDEVCEEKSTTNSNQNNNEPAENTVVEEIPAAPVVVIAPVPVATSKPRTSPKATVNRTNEDNATLNTTTTDSDDDQTVNASSPPPPSDENMSVSEKKEIILHELMDRAQKTVELVKNTTSDHSRSATCYPAMMLLALSFFMLVIY